MSESIYPIITQAEAKNQGLKFYFTGKPCKRGHISQRYTTGSSCTLCHEEYQKTDKVKEYQREYAKTDKCKDMHREYQKTDNFKELQKKHQKTDKYREYHREYSRTEKIKEYQKTDKFKDRQKEYQKHRKLTDPLFKLTCGIRTLICNSIKRGGFEKSSKTAGILCCSFEDFKIHIENQFTDGMNWDNQGEWHFDHIYPVSRAIDEAHLIALNHYTNFQPLWAEDNLKKGRNII